MLFSNKMRKNRAARWSIERPDDSKQNEHRVNCKNGARSERRQNQKKNKTQTKSYVAANQDFAAIENVGDVSGEEEEHDPGEELREADEAEVEGALGDFVDLPADGDGLHFEGEHDEAAGALKNLERRIAERGSRIVVRV